MIKAPPPTASNAVGDIHARTCTALASTLQLNEALAVSLAAAAPRDCDAVFGMLLNSAQAKSATKHAKTIAITDEEWKTLFGKECAPMRDGGVRELISEKAFGEISSELEAALRCTFVEVQSKQAWERPHIKLACYLALHSDDSEGRVSACLGGIVRADSRRLDDVRSGVEDCGGDYMRLTKTVIALSNAVLP